MTLLILGKRAGPSGLQPPYGVNCEVPFAAFEKSGRTLVTLASNGAMSLDEFLVCYGAGRRCWES